MIFIREKSENYKIREKLRYNSLRAFSYSS